MQLTRSSLFGVSLTLFLTLTFCYLTAIGLAHTWNPVASKRTPVPTIFEVEFGTNGCLVANKSVVLVVVPGPGNETINLGSFVTDFDLCKGFPEPGNDKDWEDVTATEWSKTGGPSGVTFSNTRTRSSYLTPTAYDEMERTQLTLVPPPTGHTTYDVVVTADPDDFSTKQYGTSITFASPPTYPTQPSVATNGSTGNRDDAVNTAGKRVFTVRVIKTRPTTLAELDTCPLYEYAGHPLGQHFQDNPEFLSAGGRDHKLQVSGGGTSWEGLFVREAIVSIANAHSPTSSFTKGAQEVTSTCTATGEGFLVGVPQPTLNPPDDGYCWQPTPGTRPTVSNGFYDSITMNESYYVLNHTNAMQGYIECKHRYRVGNYTFPETFRNRWEFLTVAVPALGNALRDGCFISRTVDIE